MGELKQLLPFKGSTLIEQSIQNLLSSKADRVVVVLGYAWERILERIKALPVTAVINETYKQGMLSSIKCGIQSLQETHGAILIALGDQPHIPTSLIDELIEAYSQGNHGIIIPKYQGKRGHPILLDEKYKNEVLQADDMSPLGLNQVIRSHTEDILEISVHSLAVVEDIDTQEDYERLRKRG
jgi:molybdenum cofactor cytidylyltransferase